MRCHGVPCTRAPVEACRGEGASACRLKVWENCDSNTIMHRGRDPKLGSGPGPKRCACILVVLAVRLPELAAERVPRLAARIRRGDKVRRGRGKLAQGQSVFNAANKMLAQLALSPVAQRKLACAGFRGPRHHARGHRRAPCFA